MRLFFAVLFIVGGLGASASTAGTYYFRKLDTNNGLSQNCVNVILQDRSGFIWLGTRDGLNRYDGNSFRTFRNDFTVGNGLKNNFVTSLYEDRGGRLWIGTDAGICIYDPELEKFEEFTTQTAGGIGIDRTVVKIGAGRDGEILIAATGLGLFSFDAASGVLTNYNVNGKHGNVREFALQEGGRLWVSFFGGLWYTDGDINELQRYHSPDGKAAFNDEAISRILFGSRNRMYLASERFGVHEVNLVTGDIRTLELKPQDDNVFVRDIVWYDDRTIWIGSEGGVYIYNIDNDSCVNLTSDFFDPYSISDNAIYSIFKDRDGDMWLGSFFGGVNYYSTRNRHFEKYYPTTGEGSLKGRRVRELCGHEDGSKIWVGTEDAGLFCFDVKTKKFGSFAPSREFPNIQGMCLDGDDLWVGTFSHGVRVIDTSTGRIKNAYFAEQRNTIRDNYVFSIYKASTGHIYLGTANYLIRYDKRDGSFTRINELDNNLIYDISEDFDGRLWVATYSNGIYLYDSKSAAWEHYMHTGREGSLPINKVLSIFEDSRKDIWVTTQGGGVCRFIPATKSFESFNSTQGLPNDVVFHIEEDDKGLFWLTTNKGLVRFDPVHGEVIKTYTVSDGLPGGQFNYKSGYRDRNNNIYLGTTQGMISFDPNIGETHASDPVFITDFLLFNQPVPVGGKGSPLEKSIMFSDRITLGHNQNTFSFSIAALNYSAPEARKLVYRLEGLDRQWQPVSESRSINYSRLPSGRYTLRIKDMDNDSAAGETTLGITIRPPFYSTSVAYIAYLLLACLAGYQIYTYTARRNRRRQQAILDKFEQNKEKELYNSKIGFFTNITHEIRTPLTLIKGPLENILVRNTVTEKETVEDLKIMKQNVDRLHELTTQLLDFRHAEKESLVLNYVRCDVSNTLAEAFRRFTPLARQKGYCFTLEESDPAFFATVDAEALTKIVSNLLNNAIKYGGSYITVQLDTASAQEPGLFSIVVENDGATLPADMTEEIFKPFVRYTTPHNSNTPGTGIGLSLARFLAEQHNGTLNVEAAENVTRFVLTLPVAQEKVFGVGTSDGDQEMDFSDVDMQQADDGRNTILVVEDDVALQKFMLRILSKKYNVVITENGRQALDVLSQQMVDLVVSDVMMPVMDGIELCSSIKDNVNYSHIPVILLTARTMMQSRIEGAEAGADSYIEKPFSTEYLQAVIENIFRNRAALKKAFRQHPMAVLSNMTEISRADEDFLGKIHEAILSNISNPDLKMENIAEMLNMSRASFYRKIKGLLDLSPNEYLRIERLKEAANLLRKGQYQVSEVCYMVGFSSLSYFSKCFFKQYDVLPKDFS